MSIFVESRRTKSISFQSFLEQNENDDVELDFTGADQAGNLADMAENLSQEEAAAAMEAIEKVRQKRADDAVRDFRTWFDAALLPILKDFAELAGAKLTIQQDHFHDITAVFTGRCGFDITATQKRMRMAMAAADHISVNRWAGSDKVEFSLIFGFPENED